jgi:hypothetical protein
MATLIFKNKKLQGIFRMTETATTFRTTFSEAVTAYEHTTGQVYADGVNLSKYNTSQKPSLWLVKDRGIYLMASAIIKHPAKDQSHVCYAEGFEPSVPNCFDKCRSAVGGDDFVEVTDFTDQLKDGIKNGADVQIEITKTHLTITLVDIPNSN